MVDELVIRSPDGTELAARRSGAGSPLVLVHGGVVSMDVWAFAEPLLAEDHQVWCYDRRGHGRSGDASDFSLRRETEDLAAVLAAAGSEVHLVGHSDGALLSLDAAARHPALRSLVLYEPAVHFDRREESFRRGATRLESGDLEGFLDVFLPEIAAASADEVAMLRAFPDAWALLVNGADRYAAHRDAFVSRIEEVLNRGWQPDAYRRIEAPTLLIVGELTQSPLFATATDVHQAIPQAELATIEGQGHLAASFDPASFASTVLAFTTAHDG